MNINISGFADEMATGFCDQLIEMRNLGLNFIEIRLIDKKPITTIESGKLPLLRQYLSDFSVRPSAIGSRIGKIDITEDFDAHFEEFKYAVEIALAVKCKNIRIFSFYIPDNQHGKYKGKVLKQLRQMIDYAAQHGITLLHENEKGIYGDTPARTLELFKQLPAKNFKAVFDFANFVQCKADTMEAFEMLKPYIDYFHIKDAVMKDGQIVPAGYGDGQIEKILSLAIAGGYNGFLSLEPHLGKFAGFESLENKTKSNISESARTTQTGVEKFKIALLALKSILNNIENS